jgi:hypothetical protein
MTRPVVEACQETFSVDPRRLIEVILSAIDPSEVMVRGPCGIPQIIA